MGDDDGSDQAVGDKADDDESGPAMPPRFAAEPIKFTVGVYRIGDGGEVLPGEEFAVDFHRLSGSAFAFNADIYMEVLMQCNDLVAATFAADGTGKIVSLSDV